MNAVLEDQKKAGRFSYCFDQDNPLGKVIFGHEKPGGIDAFFRATGYIFNEDDLKCQSRGKT